MSANFLSLNPDKTEFLLIGYPKQLSKVDHPTLSLPDDVTLSPAKSARNLGVIFDSNHSFTAISKSCLYIISVISKVPLIGLLLVSLPLPLFMMMKVMLLSTFTY